MVVPRYHPYSSSPTSTRSEKSRMEKAEQRKRTRLLIDALDPLVPVFSRACTAEKGSLKSKRTLLQLQEDTVFFLKKITQKKATRHDYVDCDIMREGMLSSNYLILVELDVTTGEILHCSNGLSKWYQLYPSDLIGQNFAHFLDTNDVSRFKNFLQLSASKATAKGIKIKMLTFGSKCYEQLECTLRAVQDPMGGRSIFLIDFERDVPRNPCSFPNWSPCLLREMSGIFRFDESQSSGPPTDVDVQMRKLSRKEQAELGWCHIGVSSLLQTESARAMLDRLAGENTPLGSMSSAFMRLVMKMVEMHLTFDFNSHEVPFVAMHARLKLPRVLGSLRTPWSLLLSSQLPPLLHVFLGFLRCRSAAPTCPVFVLLIKTDCDNEGWRCCMQALTELLWSTSCPLEAVGSDGAPPGAHYRQEGGVLRCYHTRSWHISPSKSRIYGQIFRDLDEKPYQFEQVS
eukprot:755138-Hanusia_phi.AAC.4